MQKYQYSKELLKKIQTNSYVSLLRRCKANNSFYNPKFNDLVNQDTTNFLIEASLGKKQNKYCFRLYAGGLEALVEIKKEVQKKFKYDQLDIYYLTTNELIYAYKNGVKVTPAKNNYTSLERILEVDPKKDELVEIKELINFNAEIIA